MSAKKRILFVDDDPDILASLRLVLHKERKRWDIVFACGGRAALDEVHREPFDLVVSDMRMPGLDGADLLNTIKEEFPATVRIMLSGQASRDAIARALPVLHQLLSKPCESAALREAIERSLEGADIARDTAISKMVAGVHTLPSPPDIYFDLMRLLGSPTASIESIVAVIVRDPAISAKVLQLVNTAYFSNGHTTTSIKQAVARLGTDQLRYLALTAAIFSAAPEDDTGWLSIQDLQRGSLRSASFAMLFANRELREDAFAAALLHDVGHIVLARGRGPDFQTLHDRCSQDPAHGVQHELDLFGVSHADIGARLLAIWGLPARIVDAVQFHHDPANAPTTCRLLASIVHVADAVVDRPPFEAQLNMDSLERAGCAEMLPRWLTAVEGLEKVVP